MDQFKRYELIEVVVPASYTGSTLDIQDIPQLRDDTTQDIIVTGMEVFSVEVVPVSTQGNAVATTVDLSNIFLTLYVDNEESIRLVPMLRLNTMFQSASSGTMIQRFEPTKIKNVKVVWNKSFLTFATPPTDNALFSVLIGVEYMKLPPNTWDQLNAGMTKGTY